LSIHGQKNEKIYKSHLLIHTSTSIKILRRAFGAQLESCIQH